MRFPGPILLALLIPACDHRIARPVDAGVGAVGQAPLQPSALDESCLEREGKAHGTNRFGDPAGTVYAGGSPLLDERTGATTALDEYVRVHHSDLYLRCRRSSADGG